MKSSDPTAHADRPKAAICGSARRRGERPGNNATPRHERYGVRTLWAFDRFYSRVYQRVRVLRPAKLPAAGPLLLVSNHTSGLDPVLIQAFCPRLVTWMMAKEYYDLKQLHWFFATVGAIPVERSGRDTAATRAALRALADGQTLGIFPEGRIARTRDLLPFQPGAALMAIKTRAPVYPVFLDGTQRGMEMVPAFLNRNEVVISFGPPVEFDRTSTSREALDQAAARIQEAVIALMPPAAQR